jgi:GT2 family glycosyltransferase
MEQKNNLNPWSPENWTVPTETILSSLPKITIGILNHNRRDDLRRTLDCITRAVQYPDMEVIVADNASHDGSVTMVAKEFPSVRVIALENNISITARNYILDEALGDFIFLYDDDSFPATPATILGIVVFMMGAKDISALNTFYYQYKTAICETRGWDLYSLRKNTDGSFEGIFIVEGGVCFRRSDIKNLRFDEHNLWGAEGMELSLRFFNESKKMILHPGYATLHAKSSVGRSRSSDLASESSSIIKMLFKNFNFLFACSLIFLYCLRRCIGFIFKPKSAKGYFKGILQGISRRKYFVESKPKMRNNKLPYLVKWYIFMLRW